MCDPVSLGWAGLAMGAASAGAQAVGQQQQAKAQYQAQHATDSRILAVMKVIAQDETRHAQLAWDIHQVLMAQLSDSEQQQIVEAQRSAAQRILEQTSVETQRQVQGFATLPTALTEMFVVQIVA